MTTSYVIYVTSDELWLSLCHIDVFSNGGASTVFSCHSDILSRNCYAILYVAVYIAIRTRGWVTAYVPS